MDVYEIVTRYAAGFFPLYDEQGNFYWERLALRAVIPVNAHTARRAKQLARRGRKRFEIRYTTAVEEIIADLRRQEIKPRSWVQEEVVAIYRTLHNAGLLRTVEAWQGEKLVGALLGITLPGTYIAETMYGIVPEASKVCLCRLVEDCLAAGIEMIDVQTPHDLRDMDFLAPNLDVQERTAHPCVRLGEQLIPLPRFRRMFETAWQGACAGGVEEWVDEARQGGSGI